MYIFFTLQHRKRPHLCGFDGSLKDLPGKGQTMTNLWLLPDTRKNGLFYSFLSPILFTVIYTYSVEKNHVFADIDISLKDPYQVYDWFFIFK